MQGKIDENEEPWKSLLAKAQAMKGRPANPLDKDLAARVVSGFVLPTDTLTLERLGRRKLVRLFTSSTFTGICI